MHHLVQVVFVARHITLCALKRQCAGYSVVPVDFCFQVPLLNPWRNCSHSSYPGGRGLPRIGPNKTLMNNLNKPNFTYNKNRSQPKMDVPYRGIPLQVTPTYPTTSWGRRNYTRRFYPPHNIGGTRVKVVVPFNAQNINSFSFSDQEGTITYTSPHLSSIEERIVENGAIVLQYNYYHHITGVTLYDDVEVGSTTVDTSESSHWFVPIDDRKQATDTLQLILSRYKYLYLSHSDLLDRKSVV